MQQDRSTRPILFVDVDGVISLFGFPTDRPPPGAFQSIDGIVHCIGDRAGELLRRLTDRFDIVWATGWEEKANEYLPHLLNLDGDLPVLTFDGAAVFGSAHWKLNAIEARRLQLAALAMRDHRDRSSFIRTFSGSNRYIVDYLAAEVFAAPVAPSAAGSD